MRYTVSSRWDSLAAFTADQTYNRLEGLGAKEPSPGFLRDVIDTFYEVGPKVALNPDLMTAHCANEAGKEGTGVPFQSVIYLTRGVIDGLGVTDGGDQGLAFDHGDDAALAHIVHLYAYVHGEIPKGHLLYGVRALDPRYQLVLDNGNAGRVVTVAGMTGKWWTGPDGHNAVIKQANAIFDEFTSPVDHPPEVVPMKDSTGVELNMTPNLIPEAGYVDSLVLDHETNAYDFLGPRTIRGVTLHRMLGWLESTDDYFHGGAPGLTDMGIDADATKMYRWNDATGAAHKDVSANRAPWASGPYRASAYGDGLKFANKYGVNAVNRDRRSLEIDGFYGDPWTDESMREYAQTTAHDAHNYGITWEQFPISNKDGFSFVCWHNEFTGTDYKECPGSVVMAQTDEFIGMVKGIMKAAQQTGIPIPPEPPKPIPVSPYPKGATEEWCRVVYDEVKVSWAAKPFAFDLKRAECRAWLAYCSSTIPAGGDYTDGHWGPLEKVIRRGNKGSNGRDYLYGNGFLYRQEPSSKQKGS